MANVSVTTTDRVTFGYNNVLSSDSGTTTPDGGITTDAFNRQYSSSLPFGDMPGQVNVAYRDSQTLATGASQTYTLSSLGVQSMAEVCQFYFEILNLIGSGVSGTLAPGASHGWTNGIPASITVGPQSLKHWVEADVTAPVVAPGSNDTITITATVGPLTYFLALAGRNP